jgi:hypothetical protein
MRRPSDAAGMSWRPTSPAPPSRNNARQVAGDHAPKKDPALEATLLTLVEPHTAGDPMNDAKWLNCRLADLQEQLEAHGHAVSRPVIGRLLKAHDYRLHTNAKELSGPAQPERNEQFEHINEQRATHVAAAQPVISVDTKKKELIGDFNSRFGYIFVGFQDSDLQRY